MHYEETIDHYDRSTLDRSVLKICVDTMHATENIDKFINKIITLLLALTNMSAYKFLLHAKA
jgi:hypothetical protein